MVIGIESRTSNAREATSEGIIPRQWQKVFQNGVLEKIPNKVGANLYAVYSGYAGDRNGEYNYLIGAMVKEGTAAPDGMVAKRVPAGRYFVLTSDQGPLPKVVPNAWQKLWKLEDEGQLPRAYQADFEIYDRRSFHPQNHDLQNHDPQNAQVDVYVGLKQTSASDFCPDPAL